MTSEAQIEQHCRSCGKRLPEAFLDLGMQPLANRLLDSLEEAADEPLFPLEVAVCGACALIQLKHTVPPQSLFSDYLYFSSVSDALLAHSRTSAEKHQRTLRLDGKSFVVEIASNDGYLLRNFVRMGVPCLGVEPAKNIAAVADRNGVPTLSEFFSAELARRIVSERGRADLILGNNVFAHVPTTNDFLEGVAHLLSENGRAVFEFPWAHEMVEHLEFDTIYHEHFFYFHVTSLVPLVQRHGLDILQVEKLPIHGGSLRVYLGRLGAARPDASVADILNLEQVAGVGKADYYEQFSNRIRNLRRDLRAEISTFKASGGTIAAYGASAKGSTLLNFCGIGAESLDFVVDRSPHKQGKLTPGMHLPILPVESLLERMPGLTLLLTWNFAEEIAAQQSKYLENGGRFLVPVPYPRYLS